MKIVQKFITNNKYYKNPTKITVKKAILHSVGCPQPSAEVFANAWQTAQYPAHGVLQADGTVYQTLPWTYKAPHVGNANSYSIGVEMTEPSQIKYTSGANFTCSDPVKAREQVRGTYNTAVELFAYLCEMFKLDPLKDIMSHHEANLAGVGTNHADPEHLWKQLNTGYTMDGFRKDVKKKMNKEDDTVTQAEFDKMFATHMANMRNNNCGAYSEKAREWATKNGICNGYGNGLYGWPEYVSREQLIQFLYNFNEKIVEAIKPAPTTTIVEKVDEQAVANKITSAIAKAIKEVKI